ncbi:hypothetical protein KUTeg_008578 [Tegillarca granosa]|uniref:Uncharacterized protein n=1 Tax=Tegillarca granosa TaxID=220873 RepID=A0ABQ9F9I6_TEGGR|nr:hypothetical protein KUTeg_008578 [Tegillarca granosa]
MRHRNEMKTTIFLGLGCSIASMVMLVPSIFIFFRYKLFAFLYMYNSIILDLSFIKYSAFSSAKATQNQTSHKFLRRSFIKGDNDSVVGHPVTILLLPKDGKCRLHIK